MGNNFAWTDELVKEFIATKFMVDAEDNVFKYIQGQIASFKEYKQPKPTYEILKCENSSIGIHDFVSEGQVGTSSNCLATNCKIISVKRLSDNSVFAVGDIVGCTLNDTIFDIKKIEISGEPYLINQELHHYLPLRNAYKTKYPIKLPSEELIKVRLTKQELVKLMKLINP